VEALVVVGAAAKQYRCGTRRERARLLGTHRLQRTRDRTCGHVGIVHREGQDGAATMEVVQGPAVALIDEKLPRVGEDEERHAPGDRPEQRPELALHGMAVHSWPRSRRMSAI